MSPDDSSKPQYAVRSGDGHIQTHPTGLGVHVNQPFSEWAANQHADHLRDIGRRFRVPHLQQAHVVTRASEDAEWVALEKVNA